MMTLRQIRHFIAVAETGSISAGAQAVFVSQSSLTLAIQQLETEIGVRLFDRHAKGMTLKSLTGKLTIGVTSLVAGYFLVELLTRFKSAYPNVTVQVVEDERPYIEHLLVSGEIDIGVLILSNIEDRDALQTEVLMHSPYRLWLPPLHPLLEHESISLADVAKQPLIQLNADEMDVHARRIWARAGLKPEIAMKTASTEAVRSLVAAGMGVSIQPDMAYRAWSLEGNMIEARKLDDLLEPLDIGLAWRRGSARPELVTPFLTIARENGSKHAAGLKHSI